MKNNIPLLLAFATFIGLATVLLSTSCLFDQAQLTEDTQVNMYVVGADTICLSPKLYNVTTLRVEEEAKMETDFVEKKFYFNSFPGVLNWIIFNSVALSIGTTSILFLLFLINNLKRRFKIEFKTKQTFRVIAPLILVIIITSVFGFVISSQKVIGLVSGGEIMSHFNIILFDAPAVIKKVVIAFLLIGSVAVIGIMMVNISISTLCQSSEDVASKKQGFKTINDSLNIFALFSGLLLAVAIIGTGLQRDMIAEHLETVTDIGLIYPDAFIYTYGISFTLILALFFLPSLMYLKYAKKKALPLPDNKPENTTWWHLGVEAVDDMKLIFSIVLPLLSSLAQHFI